MADAGHFEPKFKPYYRSLQKAAGDQRTPERIVAHYQLERRLADRLRQSTREERAALYPRLYGELFDALPDHPQRTRNPAAVASRRQKKLPLLLPYVHGRSVYLEIGCGDATMAFAMAAKVARAYGLDVTDALVDHSAAPRNFAFLRSSGIDVPLLADSVDFAYSNQLMEHLHGDDVEDQLREIFRVLKPGGRYYCTTPNRVTGPHDVSRYFDDTATGFHLREYDYRMIRETFGRAGFSQVRFPVTVRNRSLGTPPYPILRGIEIGLLGLPPSVRRHVVPFAKFLMGINAVATK